MAQVDVQRGRLSARRVGLVRLGGWGGHCDQVEDARRLWILSAVSSSLEARLLEDVGEVEEDSCGILMLLEVKAANILEGLASRDQRSPQAMMMKPHVHGPRQASVRLSNRGTHPRTSIPGDELLRNGS